MLNVINIILEDVGLNHDNFQNILLLDFLDEKRVLSLLKKNKCKYQSFNLNSCKNEGDVAAHFTNLDEDSTVIIFYTFNEIFDNFFIETLRDRKFEIVLDDDNNTQNIEIWKNQAIVIANSYESFSKKFIDIFQLKINIGTEIIQLKDVVDNISNQSFDEAKSADGSYKLNTYYNIRLGFIRGDVSGDFIDHQNEDLSFQVFEAGYENEYIIIYNKKIGLRFYSSPLTYEILNSYLSDFSRDDLDKGLLIGLIQSAIDNDADGVINFDESLEEKYFSANETDDVEGYNESIFAISSVSSNIEGHIMTNDGDIEDLMLEEKFFLTELYGRIDEDMTWVVGVSLS